MSKQIELVERMLSLFSTNEEAEVEEVTEVETKEEEEVQADETKEEEMKEDTKEVTEEETKEDTEVEEVFDPVSITVALMSAGVDPKKVSKIVKDLEGGDMMSLVEEVLVMKTQTSKPGERKTRVNARETAKRKIEQLDIV